MHYLYFSSKYRLDSIQTINILIKLNSIFRRDSVDELIKMLPVASSGEFDKFIPFDQLTLETAIYWRSLIEYLQCNDIARKQNDYDDDEDAEPVDRVNEIIGELSTFCDYLTK